MYIDHIAIWTNNLERLIDFYSNYFNCSVSERYDNKLKQFSSYFLSFQDGVRIEIMQRADISEGIEKEKIGLAHFALVVGTKDQVDNLTKSFEQAGVIVESYPRTTGDGYYESVILDPDNNKIELIAMKE
ncbi:MAG: VOC family protein [Prolixibacteraceae bacterium]|nr:VOC family protein [Prolixibacteraceae bacterium]